MSRFHKYARAVVLSILFGMLIISFGFWGIGDMLRVGRTDTTVAEVGNTKISAREVRDRLARILDQFQARGSSISMQQAVQFGLHVRALDEAIKAAVIDQAAKDLGIAISDEQVRQSISEFPEFRDATGKFDQMRFVQALRRAGLSEVAFVADMRRELAANQMLGSVAGSTSPPAALRDGLFRYRREKRVAELFVLPFDSIRDVPQATAEQLKTYYEANQVRFRVPEYRALSYVVLTVADVMGEISVSEDQLRRTYEEKLPELTKPEMRDIDQVVVAADEAAAKRIVELVRGGKNLADAAKEVMERDAVIKLGPVAQKDLPPGLAEGAFGLKAGEVGGPFRSDLGWHVVRVNSIEAGGAPSFESVRGELEDALKHEQAPDLLYRRIRDFDVALGRSDSLAEAAKVIGATVQQVDAVSAEGATPTGGKALSIPAAQDIVKTAFTLREGQLSALLDTRAGDSYVVKVDRIVPARQPPLSEVETQVTLAWQAAERQKLATARAKEIVDRLNAVSTIEAQAQAAGQPLRVSKPVSRYEEDKDSNLTAALVGELFALAPGRSTSVTTSNGVAILRLKETLPGDPAASPDELAKFSTEIGGNTANDLIVQMLSAFERRYGRRVHERAFEQAFSSDQQQ